MRIREIIRSLAVIALVGLSFRGAAEEGGNLPAPLLAHLQAASPGKLVEAAERLCGGMFAGVKEKYGDDPLYRPGTLRAIAERLLPEELLAAENAAFDLVMVLRDDSFPLDIALALDGVDDALLEKYIEERGLAIEFDGDAAVIDGDGMFPGGDVHLVRLGDGRLVFANDAELGRKFARVLADWRPEPLASGDVRLRVDLRRLLAYLNPSIIMALEGMDAADALSGTLPHFPVSDDEDENIRRNAGMKRLLETYHGLLGQFAAADVLLTVDDELVRVDCRLDLVDEFGDVTFLAERYAEAGNPEFTVEGMAEEDALLFTAFTDEPGRLFSWAGGLTNFAAEAYAALLPERFVDFEALQCALAFNDAAEEATALYLRDNRLLHAVAARVPDGARRAEAWLAAKDMIETVVFRRQFRDRVHGIDRLPLFDVASGRIGGIDFRRIRPLASGDHFSLLGGTPDEALITLLGRRVLLADSGEFFLALCGEDASPAQFPALAARASGVAENRLVDDEEFREMLGRLERRNFGYAMAKPVDLLCGMLSCLAAAGVMDFGVPVAVIDEYFRDFPGLGRFAGISFGAEPGALTVEAALPMAALNGVVSFLCLADRGDFDYEHMEAVREAWEERERERRERYQELFQRMNAETYWRGED